MKKAITVLGIIIMVNSSYGQTKQPTRKYKNVDSVCIGCDNKVTIVYWDSAHHKMIDTIGILKPAKQKRKYKVQPYKF